MPFACDKLCDVVELTRTYPMPVGVVVLRFVAFFLQRTALIAGIALGIPLGLGILGTRLGSDLLTDVPPAVDEFLLRWLAVTAIVAGAALALGWVVGDVFRGTVRRTLDRFAAAPETDLDFPVEWQRRAVRRGRKGPRLAVVGVLLLLAGGFLLLVALLELEGLLAVLTGLVAAVPMVAGGLMAVFGLLRRRGPAVERWGGRDWAPLDPREPRRRFNSDGEQMSVDTLGLKNARADKEALRASPPALRRSSALWSVSRWLFAGAASTFVLGIIIAWGVTELDNLVSGRNAFTVVLVLFILTVVMAAAGAITSTLGTRTLRQTILAIAARPDAPAPPWHLLRLVLLEEYPLQALTNHLHTLGTLSILVGITGNSLGDVSGIGALGPLWTLLTTLGGVAWLFHASGWFWRRRVTSEQNTYLHRRWFPEATENS